MSSTSAPFGLRPAYHPSGILRPEVSTIATGYASNIFQFQPIKIVAAGGIEAAAAGDRFCGVFMGVEWTDSDGRRRFSPDTATRCSVRERIFLGHCLFVSRIRRARWAWGGRL